MPGAPLNTSYKSTAAAIQWLCLTSAREVL